MTEHYDNLINGIYTRISKGGTNLLTPAEWMAICLRYTRIDGEKADLRLNWVKVIIPTKTTCDNGRCSADYKHGRRYLNRENKLFRDCTFTEFYQGVTVD